MCPMRESRTYQTFILFLFFANIIFLFACGRRGPSLPPVKVMPARASDLQARQIDDSVILAFLIPEKNTDGSLVQEALSTIVLCFVEQVQEEASSPTHDEFLKRAKTCMKVDSDRLYLKKRDQRVFVKDKVFERYGAKAKGKRFSYAIQLKNEKGRVSALSQIASLTVGETLPAPSRLQAIVLEEGIQLSWEYPPSGADEKKEQVFNVYRLEVVSADRSLEEEADQKEILPSPYADFSDEEAISLFLEPINDQPVSGADYIDRATYFGTQYIYSVRSLLDESGVVRESKNSNIIQIQPRDIFPPRTPEGLVAIAEGAVIRLFWYPNSEKDIGGYKIYRSVERSGPYALIAETLAHMTSYTDNEISTGQKYHYYVTSFDNSELANESSSTPIISEMALPVVDGQSMNNGREHERE